MRRGLIAWILLIISALVMYFFSNESVTLALLAALIVAVPVSLLILKFGSRGIEVSLGDAVHSDGRSTFTLTIRNKGWLPVSSAEVEVKCENLRTGESDLFDIRRSLMPRRSVEIPLEVTLTHAGRYEVSASSCTVSDPLGIWEKEIGFRTHRHMTSLPDIYEMHIRPVSTAAMPESDLYSVKRKGSVAGDMVGIREYVAGDPVRNIHWKLSEKTDKLLVKELGEPQTDNYLLLLDSASGIAQDPEALDAVASVFASLMHSLRLSDLSFNAGWTDPMSGEATIREVFTEEDYNRAVDSFLAVPAAMPGAFARIETDISESRYARVIIVGPRVPENIEALTNGCEATVLMYGGSSVLSDNKVTVIGFDAGTYRESLATVEL